MSTDSNLPPGPPEAPGDGPMAGGAEGPAGRLSQLPIEEELKDSYLTYAMSVIVSRALPDVRDGLKPSQRRILVAMNDLNLGPGAARVKCAKISGDTSGNYHPHGESVIYPTLVRMAQEWNLRHVLIDKQGNFGSIAGLPPAAMRYTEARMSPIAALMLDDIKLDTVDYVPTYDERHTEPTVLPSKFPNLLVNGANGIAVGMATSIPPHNLGEVCDGLIRLIDQPNVSIDELLEIIPGPDFPTGGIICGRSGIRRGYHTGRGTVVVRARAHIEEMDRGYRIVVTEIPYQQARDRVEERIAALVNEGRIPDIRAIRNESDLDEPVRLILELKRDADPEIVLNQLYKFSPLQDTFSLIFLALVDGKPRVLSLKGILEEFLRHRITVIRRRTQFLLAKARQRKHTVEGLLLAHANIDEVIRVIRSSKTQAEAKDRLMQTECPAAMLARALGESGFAVFQEERGAAENYTLTPVQADAILRMTLGQLVNLEQEKLGDEHRNLLADIGEYRRILSDEQNIRAIIRQDLEEVKRKHSDKRRTEVSGDELGDIDLEDLIEEETMVVSISSNGYIKRTPITEYRTQRRGGKGSGGPRRRTRTRSSTCSWPAPTPTCCSSRTSAGSIVRRSTNCPNLLSDSRGRRDRQPAPARRRGADHGLPRGPRLREEGSFLVMATAGGLVKKTPLKAYGRPMKAGIIAIKLREGDELVDVVVAEPGDELVLSTAHGMAIRFRQSDVRAMGRNSSGVKGIQPAGDDKVVGMVVADPGACLLTVCANGYGKRTPFGPNLEAEEGESEPDNGIDEEAGNNQNGADEPSVEDRGGEPDEEEEVSSQRSYRTQRRGGKGLRDIKTSERNGPVIGVVRICDDDELLMITARGKLQRIAANEVSVLGRNTQGVRVMNLDEDDTLVAVKRVPQEDANGETEEE